MGPKRGEYWKEQFGFFTPVKLADGREVWSVGDVVIVNVQNGRSTIVTATRASAFGVIRQACSASRLCKASCVEDPSSNRQAAPIARSFLSLRSSTRFMRFVFSCLAGLVLGLAPPAFSAHAATLAKEPALQESSTEFISSTVESGWSVITGRFCTPTTEA